jgi:hypothetical protein
MQRPRPKEAANIGTWRKILEIISYLAVVTNCGILVWTSDELNKYAKDEHGNVSIYTKLLIGVILEHAIFLFKFFLAEFIPDAPGWVVEANARKTYYKQLLVEDAIKLSRSSRRGRSVPSSSVNAETTESHDGFVAPQPKLVGLDE